MLTKKQEALIHTFLSALDDDTRLLYEELLACLSELGYTPSKERGNLSFHHDLHSKQIAKMGIRSKDLRPFFALRFSACQELSPRFTDITAAYAAKYPARGARCIDNACTFCAGDPAAHVYYYTSPGGGRGAHCGAYAIELPRITAPDVTEIKKLLREEHAYLLRHETGTEG